MPVSLATGSHAAPLKDRKDDLYPTPPAATRALMAVHPLPVRIWEPCAGQGHIVDVLIEGGHTVVASDLVDYGRRDVMSRVDFLMETQAPKDIDTIVTNVPYKLGNEMSRHALDLVPNVCMLFRLAFLESAKRSDIIDGGRLARVLLFKDRLPMMHRHGWTGPKANSAIPFAWFIWNRNHNGPTILERISWRDYK